MNETYALEEDYRKLNQGAGPDVLSQQYAQFHGRISELWWKGKELDGKSGIVPIRPFPEELPHLCLEFFLVEGPSKKRFECFHMDTTVAEAHARLFVSLYENGKSDSGTEGASQEGRWMEMKLQDRSGELVTAKGKNVQKDDKPAKPTVVWRARRKKNPSDPFDPFAGILY